MTHSDNFRQSSVSIEMYCLSLKPQVDLERPVNNNLHLKRRCSSVQFLHTGRCPTFTTLSLFRNKATLAWKTLHNVFFLAYKKTKGLTHIQTHQSHLNKYLSTFVKLSRMALTHWGTQAKGSSCHLKELLRAVLLVVVYLIAFYDIKALHPLYAAQLKITNF